MNHKARWLGQLLAGTCLLSPCYAQVAPAQTTAPGAAPAAKSAPIVPTTQLEEVVVKAQRRSERLQKVPIAVTAVSGSQLAAHGETSVLALTASVPNMSLNQIGTAVTPYIRGVGSNGSNPNDEQSVALYVDGVYIASPIGNIFDFNNIDQIEVLKGPQGTLFGRNATGGVIQILTKDPSSTPSGQASIGYGNYDTITSSLYATGGGDGIAVCFFGDGALAEGILHECLNIAQLKTIPVLFVCENNGWSEFSATSTQVTFTLEKLAAAYGIAYFGADGADVESVAALAAEVISRMRRERGPIVLEFTTTRIRGHYEGDAQRYRTDKTSAADPLAVARAELEARAVPFADLEAIEATIRSRVRDAVAAARLSPEPTLQSAAEDVYAMVGG
jgi:hypothetical protein